MKSMVLYLLAKVYQTVVFTRNYFYDIGFLTSVQVNQPSICVGNLSVGGTGKTPMVEKLIKLFRAQRSIAIVSRGYKRESTGMIVADKKHGVKDLGDEPFQIWKKFQSDIALIIDANRIRAVNYIYQKYPSSLILFDDAFQHRKIKANINLLLTTFSNPFFKDDYLPNGSLRDHKNQIARADLLLVTKCPQTLSKIDAEQFKSELKISLNQVYFCCLKYQEISPENLQDLCSYQKNELALVTGLARTEELEAYLKGLNLNYTLLKFPDHHNYTTKDLKTLNTFNCVLTTEKDKVKLSNLETKMQVIKVGHHFLFNQESEFLEKISAKLNENLTQ
tara:strand:+ start:25059 stop:26060 length:1002 start_codon:yes stop_codon:yes gene_type:complete